MYFCCRQSLGCMNDFMFDSAAMVQKILLRQNIICFILPIADVFNVMRLIMKYIAGSRGRRSIMDMALDDIINKVLPGSFGKIVPCKAVLTVLRPCPDEKSAIVWRLGELSVTLQTQKWYHALSQMFNQ